MRTLNAPLAPPGRPTRAARPLARRLFALSLVVHAGLLAGASAVAQSTANLLYGKVVTQSGNSYTGAIRWGKEELTWDDQFNATKPDNPYLDYLSTEQRDNLRRGRRFDGRSWYSGSNRYWSNWANDWSSSWSSDDNKHMFVTRFGDLKSLRTLGSSRVEVTLRNGERLTLSDGSNDVGATLQVMDPSLGLIKVDWSNLDRVEFQAAPADLKASFGTPLYGTLVTRFGTYKGTIQWDLEEAVGGDILTGNSEDGKFDIQMDRIARLERNSSSSTRVQLKDGRSLVLRGTNDVNSENRGIAVKSPTFGTVEVTWDDFESLEFTANPGTAPGYEGYAPTKRIRGTVVSKDGQRYTGEIAYDLDETYDNELLNGKVQNSEFQIPFRLIQKIVPQGDAAEVTLRSGAELLLRDQQDVNERHSGVLVMDRSNKRSAYLAWAEIREILLD